MNTPLRIGTRGSPLAQIQARIVRDCIIKFHPTLKQNCEILVIDTSGDWKSGQGERTFLELGGGKGLFTKEIEGALLDGAIDMAVHSMKDMPVEDTHGLDIAAILERVDPRDAFVSAKARTLDDLPKGAVVGTSSLRRQAQVLAQRHDLQVIPLRGNVDTRLRKLDEGAADATLLAVAGLARLGKEARIASIMDAAVMLPCAGQGALGIQIRKDEKRLRVLLEPLGCAATMACVKAERAAMKALDGSCRTPIGALAKPDGQGNLALDVFVATPDGRHQLRRQGSGPVAEAETMGTALGLAMKTEWMGCKGHD